MLEIIVMVRLRKDVFKETMRNGTFKEGMIPFFMNNLLRGQSSITKMGGGSYKTVVGQVKFYPNKKGSGKRLSHAEEGNKMFWGRVTQVLEVLAILNLGGGGAQKVCTL